MLLGTSKEINYYNRTRNGKPQKVSVTRTIYLLQCDSCKQEFSRVAKKFNKKSGTHVCNNCNQKQFAQTQSATWRKFNRLDASAGVKI